MHRSLCPLYCQSWGIFAFMSLFLISQDPCFRQLMKHIQMTCIWSQQASTLHNVDYKYEKSQREKSSGVLDNSSIKKIKDNSKLDSWGMGTWRLTMYYYSFFIRIVYLTYIDNWEWGDLNPVSLIGNTKKCQLVELQGSLQFIRMQ